MDFEKFIEILNKFSKNDIIIFLGKNYDMIKEWTQDENSYTKESLVNILVSITGGFPLLKNKEFREIYFQHVDLEDLRIILSDDQSNYEELAKKAAKIEFRDNPFYKNYLSLFLDCPDYSFEYTGSENMHDIISKNDSKFYELLDYQYLIKEQTIFELNRKSSIGRKILIHMPTGTGKTKTTMHIIANYLNFINKNGLVMWVAHTNELLRQAYSTFQNVWGHLGLNDVEVEKSWGIGEYSISKGIIFISIQALQQLRDSIYNDLVSKVSLLVYDECHKIGARQTKHIINDFMKPNSNVKKDFIGLTATPGRSTELSIENRSFADFFDRQITIDVDTINKISMQPMEVLNCKPVKSVIAYFQERGILSKIEKKELNYESDLEIMQKLKLEFISKREKYSDAIIEKIARNKSRNTEILNTLKELHSLKKPTIVFACSVAHAQMLSAFLNIEKIPNSLVYGDMSTALRKKEIDEFKDINNPKKIIINYDILTTGFDSVGIDCVFITRPTKSVILYSQMIGRGLRGPQMGGNPTCLLIDVKENLEVFDENEAFSHFKDYWR